MELGWDSILLILVYAAIVWEADRSLKLRNEQADIARINVETIRAWREVIALANSGQTDLALQLQTMLIEDYKELEKKCQTKPNLTQTKPSKRSYNR